MSKKKNHVNHSDSKKNWRKENPDNSRKLYFALAAILFFVALIYFPSLKNGFVTLDDDHYVQNNPLIQHFNLKELLTTYWMGNYHPLVMLCYTFIYSVAKESPFAYHFVNLIFHLVNTSLVLLVIFELTSVFEIAVIVSLLFGIHPLHVESVAWISELKDLMYTGFFLASLIYYLRYIKHQFNRKYLILSLIFFMFSVLSKGMGVSLSIVLLLIDYFLGRKMEAKLFVEKIPFFIISIVFGLLAVHVQSVEQAVQDFALYTFSQRLVFASYGFVIYIFKLFLPINMSAYYPYPISAGENIPSFYYFFPIILIANFIVVFFSMRKSKIGLFGVGFYAVSVALMLQIIPVGGAIIADRYTYIPSIGIFLIVAYGLYSLYKNNSYKTIAVVILGVMTLGYSTLTYQRTQVWKDGMTLLNDILSKGDVAMAYYNRGILNQNSGESEKAIQDYSKAIQLFPDYADAFNNRGLVYSTIAKNQEALIDYNKALSLNPNFTTAYYNRGNIFYATGDNQKAATDFDKTIQFDSTFAKAYCNRANIYYVNNDFENAIHNYSKAIQFDSALSNAYFYRAIIFEKLNRAGEACNDYRKAASFGDANAVNRVSVLCK